MKDLKQEIIQKASKHGVELVESTMQTESMGLDFQVAFAKDTSGQAWVCRLPRRKDVMEKIQTEKNILDFIHKYQSAFEVPVWEVVNEDIILYKKLEGVPAVTTDTETHTQSWAFDTKNVPETYLTSLAESLAALHALPLDKAVEAGVTVQEANEVRQLMKDRMQKVKEAYDVHPELWERWQTWVGNDALWPDRTGVTHGDLFPGHTLVDSDHAVTGLIDWTETSGTDTSIDFTAFYLLFGEEVLDRLLEKYQAAGGHVWPIMKEHIIERLATQAITIAEFATSSGLDDYRIMAQNMLKLSD